MVTHPTQAMKMLGSFPATDISTFQMFQNQSVQSRGGHCQHSASPWTQQTAEHCQNYQLPAEVSSRLPSDQFTPHEYPTVTKLLPRQLQWVTSNACGYDTASTALSYDVDMVQSQGYHHGQLHQVAVTTSNTDWSPLFNQHVTPNFVSAATDCSGSNHLIQTFQGQPKNCFAECPLEQSRDVMIQSVSGQRQFTDTSSVMSAFTAGQPQPPVSDSMSYCAPPANLYSRSGIKSDPDGPSDWQCTLPLVWHQQEVRLKSSPGQQSACTSTTSPLPYPSTAPYTPVPAEMTPWSTTCEQKSIQPMTITPSTSVGQSTNFDIIVTDNVRCRAIRILALRDNFLL